MSKAIPGIKLIWDTGQYKGEDDPSLPYRLDVIFSTIEHTFGEVNNGIAQIIVRAATKKGMEEFLELNGFENRRHFVSLTLTGPEGVIKEIKR